jgi:hypothetical protein
MKVPVDLSVLHSEQKQAVVDFAREPRNFSGRGIVTSIYDRDFPSLWVLLSELVRLGVRLPVEAFHLPGEISEKYAALARSLDLDLKLLPLNDKIATRFAIKAFCNLAELVPRGPVARCRQRAGARPDLPVRRPRIQAEGIAVLARRRLDGRIVAMVSRLRRVAGLQRAAQ